MPGKFTILSLSFYLLGIPVAAQISPGDLSNVHAHLEGLSNCTQCHVLGSKVENDKCLFCHTDIKGRISLQKGYHASSEVKGKNCFACHSEHNGKNFQLIRLDQEKFDHNLTGFALSVPHAKKACFDCHKAKNIADTKIRDKKNTFLGVGTECLTCHEDYHQSTLSNLCLNCHNPEAFKPVTKFNHDNARFKLIGKHKTIDCAQCHRIETLNGKKFQQFKGLEFNQCTNCHKDVHNNQFGQDCLKCHTEESFHTVKGMANFDHDKTKFKLVGKHQLVSCKGCHKSKLTDPVRHNRCSDCHYDYHKKQFVKNGVSPDCSECHSEKGFTSFNYTIEKHNQSVFPLKGAHLAIPCFDCHKKQEQWSFRQIGIKCFECHRDIHKEFIQAKYYPGNDCKFCHSEEQWSSVSFDHKLTKFNLTGAHLKVNCRNCHISTDSNGKMIQKFTGLSQECSLCHKDNHFKQFEKNGVTFCEDCHTTENWKASKFDHNNAAFKLDGKHVNVPCYKCHLQQQLGTDKFVLYKLKEFKCESCHS